MEPRVLILLVVLITSMCPETHGQFGKDIYRRVYGDVLMKIFEMAYTMSEPFGPFGLQRKSLYFLSTYMTQYPQAIAACKALKGHLAEMNSAMELTFVSHFLRNYTQETDEVFISGYRTSNQGSFLSSVGVDVDMIEQVNAFDEGRGNSRVYSDNSLYVFFHTNRPRFQSRMPTCLSIEHRSNLLAMNNGKCADPNYQRYLCETVL